MTPNADAHTHFAGEKHGEDGEMDKPMRPGDAAAVVLTHTSVPGTPGTTAGSRGRGYALLSPR